MLSFTVVISCLLVLLVIYECWMLFLIRHPATLSRCSRRTKNTIGHLYVFGERRIMQFIPECGRHDRELGYTLKPGTFNYAEREFSNRYFINSLGVRDSEEVLDYPEVVVLGDSFSVGWGVEAEETYAKIIERTTGLKVLNTAIPSYGTAREMEMLRRVKTDRLKYLIIQYCNDDYDENRNFYLNKNKLRVMRAETFADLTRIHGQRQRYYFGKYVRLKIQKRISEFKKPAPVTVAPVDLDETDLFMNALLQNQQMLANVQLIVFEMNGRNQTNRFSKVLQEKIATREYPAFLKKMRVFDMSEVLNHDHFYALDDHMNHSGHAVVAEKLSGLLNQKDKDKQ